MADPLETPLIGPPVRIDLFGGVSTRRGDTELDLGGAKARAALAVLALNSPRAVDTGTLADALWGDRLPADPRRDLRTIMSRLRSVLGPGSVVAVRGAGYRLTIPRDALDVVTLERAAARARQAQPAAAASSADALVEELQRVLATTAGEPLGAIASTAYLQAVARSLTELRCGVEDRLAELLVDRADGSGAIGLLEELVARTPLHEDRWALLMSALARAGRTGEALRCYQRAREQLVSNLGVEPGARLRSLEAAVLNGDLTRDRDAAPSTPPAALAPSTPDTRYVEVDGLSVAYQVWGSGPMDVVLVPQLVSHLEVMVEIAAYRSWIESLADFCRLIVFDKRGNGMSDRLSGPILLEHRTADIGAVLDDVGVDRAALLGVSEGGSIALLFAALHPDRVSCVATAGSIAAGRLAAGIWTEAQHDAIVERIRTTWGTGNDFWIYELAAPSLRDAPLPLRRAYERLNRVSCTPAVAAYLWDLYGRIDIRSVLGMVRCPVLVHHRQGEPLADFAPAQLLGGLRHAECSTVPGCDHAAWVADIPVYLAPIRDFLERHCSSHPVPPSRALATIVVAELGTAVAAGDLPSPVDVPVPASIRRLHAQATRFGGRIIEGNRDSLVASFTLPSEALDCAVAIRDLADALDLDASCAVHTGEIEVLAGGALGGSTLDLTVGLCRTACAGEVLVSDVVRQLGLGSHHRFEPIGERRLGRRSLSVARLDRW